MKKLKKYWVPIVCVIVVVLTFVLLFYMKSKVGEVSNKTETENFNETKIENKVEENNETVENTSIEENKIEEKNTVSENTVVNKTEDNEVISSSEDKYSEKRQAKAIELVKENWGKDDSVYFTNESVISNSEYTVAVRDKSSTAVKHYFRVNIDTGKVEEDY